MPHLEELMESSNPDSRPDREYSNGEQSGRVGGKARNCGCYEGVLRHLPPQPHHFVSPLSAQPERSGHLTFLQPSEILDSRAEMTEEVQAAGPIEPRGMFHGPGEAGRGWREVLGPWRSRCMLES